MNRTRRSLAISAALGPIPTLIWGQSAAPTITGVGGYSDGVGVSNGRWTGQPMANPRSNAYLNYFTVSPVNDSARNLSMGSTYYWTISGTNFGTTPGSVWVLDTYASDVGVSVKVISWSNTSIKVIANAAYTFSAKAGARLWISRLTTRPAPASSVYWIDRAHPVVGLIQSRGYGQCTWFVAKTRLAAGFAIPPTAYAVSSLLSGIGGISNYIPQQWDALNYGGRHVGIITSAITATTNADRTITYGFRLREMNALTDEAESSSTRYYRVSAPNASGQRTVLQMVGSNAGSLYVATGYYR